MPDETRFDLLTKASSLVQTNESSAEKTTLATPEITAKCSMVIVLAAAAAVTPFI